MTVKVLEFKREDWRDAAKTLRKIADDLDAGEHPECTVGVLTLIGAKEEVTVFGLGPKCDDLQCLGALRLGEQKLIDLLLDIGEGQVCRSWVRHGMRLALLRVQDCGRSRIFNVGPSYGEA